MGLRYSEETSLTSPNYKMIYLKFKSLAELCAIALKIHQYYRCPWVISFHSLPICLSWQKSKFCPLGRQAMVISLAVVKRCGQVALAEREVYQAHESLCLSPTKVKTWSRTALWGLVRRGGSRDHLSHCISPCVICFHCSLWFGFLL